MGDLRSQSGVIALALPTKADADSLSLFLFCPFSVYGIVLNMLSRELNFIDNIIWMAFLDASRTETKSLINEMMNIERLCCDTFVI